MTDDTTNDRHRTSESTLNRRRLLQTVGAGALAGGTGLAGCLGGLEGGPSKEKKNAPNATYEPTDEHPLIGYDKTVRTATKTVGGNEVEIELTIDFFLYDLLEGQYGAGTILIPNVAIAGVPLTSFADKSIEDVMNNPDDRQEILESLNIDSEIARAQSNPQMVGGRDVPNPDIFGDTGDVQVETWVMSGEGTAVLVDVVKGKLSFASVDGNYDGEVTFATGVQRTYTADDDMEAGGLVGSVIPQDDVERARTQHDGLMEGGLTILENPQEYLPDTTEKLDAPNTTYEPTDEHPLRSYDAITRTGTTTADGEEQRVQVTIDSFGYDLQNGRFGAGTLCTPQVAMGGVDLVSADTSVEGAMNDPGKREQLLSLMLPEGETPTNTGDTQRIGTRGPPEGQQVFDPDADEPTIGTWVTVGENRSVLLDVTKGTVNLGPLPVTYDGEVTFVTGIYTTYDQTPPEGESPIGTVLPQDDVEQARTQHVGLMEEGLVILEDPGQYLEEGTTTTTPPTTTTTDGESLAGGVDCADGTARFKSYANVRGETVEPKWCQHTGEERSAAWEVVWNDESYQQMAEEARGLGFEREGFGLHEVQWNGSRWFAVSTTFEASQGDYGYGFTPVERTDDGSYTVASSGGPTGIFVGATRGDGDQVNVHSIIPRTDAAPMILGLVTALASFEPLMGCSVEDWGLICSMKHFGLGLLDTRLTHELHAQESGFLPQALGKITRSVPEDGREQWFSCWSACSDGVKNGSETDCDVSPDCGDGSCASAALLCGGVSWAKTLACAHQCAIRVKEGQR